MLAFDSGVRLARWWPPEPHRATCPPGDPTQAVRGKRTLDATPRSAIHQPLPGIQGTSWSMLARMRPSRNDIIASARAFAQEWHGETSERGEAQTFWTEFLAVFGIQRRRVHAAFERHARRSSTLGGGFIDLIWPGMILAEHKSAGEDLDAAADQALDYLDLLPDRDVPRLVLVSDFARMGVMDLEAEDRPLFMFPLARLADEIDRFLEASKWINSHNLMHKRFCWEKSTMQHLSVKGICPAPKITWSVRNVSMQTGLTGRKSRHTFLLTFR